MITCKIEKTNLIAKIDHTKSNELVFCMNNDIIGTKEDIDLEKEKSFCNNNLDSFVVSLNTLPSKKVIDNREKIFKKHYRASIKNIPKVNKRILRNKRDRKKYYNRLFQSIFSLPATNFNKYNLRHYLKDILKSESLTTFNFISKITDKHNYNIDCDDDDVIPFDASEYEKILTSTMEKYSDNSNQKLDCENLVCAKENELNESKNHIHTDTYDQTESEINERESQFNNELNNLKNLKNDLSYYYSLTDIKYCMFDDDDKDKDHIKANKKSSLKSQKSSFSSLSSSLSRSSSSLNNNSNEFNSLNSNYFECKKYSNKLQKSVTLPNANDINNSNFENLNNSITISNNNRFKSYSSNISLNSRNKTALKSTKNKMNSKNDYEKQCRLRKLNELSKNKYYLLKENKKAMNLSKSLKIVDISNKVYMKKIRKFRNYLSKKTDNSDEADYDDNIEEDDYDQDESFLSDFNDNDYDYDYDYNCLVTSINNENERFHLENISCYNNNEDEGIYKKDSGISKCFCSAFSKNSTSAYDTCSNLSSNISPNNTANLSFHSKSIPTDRTEKMESLDFVNSKKNLTLLNCDDKTDIKNKTLLFESNNIPLKLNIVDESSTTCTDVSDPHWDGYTVSDFKKLLFL